MLSILRRLLKPAAPQSTPSFKQAYSPDEHDARISAVLQNIESYNGTSEGQRQV